MIKLETRNKERAEFLVTILRQMWKRTMVLGSAVLCDDLSWHEMETCKYLGPAWTGMVSKEDVKVWDAQHSYH